MASKKGLAEIIPQDSGYDYLNVLPIRINKKTGAKELAIPGLLSGAVNSIYDAVTLPKDVYSGEREATPDNTLNLALLASGLGGRPVVRPPSVTNSVVYPELTPMGTPVNTGGASLTGRQLFDPDKVTHASRNISDAELKDILSKGAAYAPKKTKHSSAEGNTKWWSAADNKGVFGRNWAKGQHTIRAPMDKISKNKPVTVADLQFYDRVKGAWVPLSSHEFARGGVIIDDANPAKRRKLI
jgi:hypothetical protein